jgi:energy-coupling factor transporter ATP-binding protein EcfA2
MTRWNISNIFFLSVSGERREVELKPGVMNIITGASGTGKSTLIKAIDYCLGSSKCELPAHVRRRSLAVGVKWVSGDAEMVIGRIVPPVGQATSSHMFTSSGRSLPLPATVADFEGATTLEAAKAFIERAFGIGDLGGEADTSGRGRGTATVRHVTPYLFVTKEVIYSETVLLHGLEKADKARDILASMPYFLRVNDEASAVAERRLRQLQRALDKEEARERSRAAADSALKQRAVSLLAEAHRIGIAPAPSPDSGEADLLAQIKEVSETQLEANNYPSEGELGGLHARRREILGALGSTRRQLQATRTAIREASGFESAVTRQREKLMLAEHLHIQDIPGFCPVCDAPSDRGRETARALQATLTTVRAESVAVERVRPKLVEHDRTLDEEIGRLNNELRQVDDQIRTWLRQSDETRRLADLAQLRAHLLGRVSFFLESSVDEPRQVSRDLSVLRTEITELEARVDREAKEIKLRRAENKISQFASEVFAALPTVAPCVGSELDFSSRQPEVTVIEAESGAVLRMPDVGSDQNYLAVHISLSFALQRYFEAVMAPVPGLLVLDQISRPYFPTSGEDEDETEIAGREEDEDVQAMRRHIDFLFGESARRSGLQILLIEHAYFADDPRYVAATRERWTRASGRALIPLDWPIRDDA